MGIGIALIGFSGEWCIIIRIRRRPDGPHHLISGGDPVVDGDGQQVAPGVIVGIGPVIINPRVEGAGCSGIKEIDSIAGILQVFYPTDYLCGGGRTVVKNTDGHDPFISVVISSTGPGTDRNNFDVYIID